MNKHNAAAGPRSGKGKGQGQDNGGGLPVPGDGPTSHCYSLPPLITTVFLLLQVYAMHPPPPPLSGLFFFSFRPCMHSFAGSVVKGVWAA